MNFKTTGHLAKLLQAYDRINRPMISEDAAAAARISYTSSHQQRCSELRSAGYIESVGVAESSRGGVSNVYKITSEGKAKLRELKL